MPPQMHAKPLEKKKKIFSEPNHWHYFYFPSLDSELQFHVFQVHLAFLMCKDFIEHGEFSLLLGFMTLFYFH